MRPAQASRDERNLHQLHPPGSGGRRLGRSDHRFALGDRLISGLYDLLEGLVAARYATAKLERLEPLNARLDLLRMQIRLLHSFQLIDTRRYEHVARLVEEVGRQLGGWISQQRRLSQPVASA